MRVSKSLCLRRIINSGFHMEHVIPKPSIWPGRERLKRFVGWQYGQSRETVKQAYNKLNKVFTYMDMQRKDAPKLEQFWAEERVSAALEEHNAADFQRFREMISRAHILLDRRMLSQLAIYEPRTFKCLVDLAQKMAMEDGRPTMQSAADLAHVQIDGRVFGAPFPHYRGYRRGPGENHLNVPRQLKLEEY